MNSVKYRTLTALSALVLALTFVQAVEGQHALPGLDAKLDLAEQLQRWATTPLKTKSKSGMGEITLGDLLRMSENDSKSAAKVRAGLEDEDLVTWLNEVLANDIVDDEWKPTTSDKSVDGFYYTGAHKIPGFTVLQMSTLVWAEPEVVYSRHREFGAYETHVGVSYWSVLERLRARKTTTESGVTTKIFEVTFRVDLPLWFDDLMYDCRFVDQLFEDGKVVINYFNLSKVYPGCNRFHHLRVRDVLIPIKDSKGKVVATGIASALAMDVAAVADGVGDSVKAMQVALGNMKRRGEAKRK